MKGFSRVLLAQSGLFFSFAALACAGLLGKNETGNFPLVAQNAAAPFLVEANTDIAVLRAANDLRRDIERVTGTLPELRQKNARGVPCDVVIVGVLGHSAALDRLISDHKVDLSPLRGAWESFVIAVVDEPLPGVGQALVIAGSDRRGAIYGCYEVSEAIGVSPYYWWADVAPAHRDELFVQAGRQRFGPPSVKYRGIFINDEDWGLQPWAAQTFEPEHGGIGPKTYAKVFELLLRLKANTLWPAMHPCTKPFNAFPENKRLADEYGIVIGSSHAEPMLRNNVSEWKDAPEKYNFAENREGVLRYWEERVKDNAPYENIYTLGMRGIHDSGMQGPTNAKDQIRLLEEIFRDQRALLAKYTTPDVARTPQMFCAYKEVLELYRGGMKVPDDVTIVWPDDNFGYVRNFATAEEQQRAGGFGVYYHLSYLGAPLSYLWLCTTPPALVWEEMTKAYDHGARTIWIVNVGDIKPAEMMTEFFFKLAWNVGRWPRESLSEHFTVAWAEREFGKENATEIASIFAEYFRLNFQRKPEHLQWWLPGEKPRPSSFTRAEALERLAAFQRLRDRIHRVETTLPATRRDAFFELVSYPVVGSVLANERYFYGELAALAESKSTDPWLERAKTADRELHEQTALFNETIAGGKWRGFIREEPANGEWPQFRLASWQPPAFPPSEAGAMDSAAHSATIVEEQRDAIVIEAEHFQKKVDRAGGAWELIPGLGHSGEGAVAVFPTTAPTISLAAAANDAPRLNYAVDFTSAGEFPLLVSLLPTHSIRAGRGLRFAVGLDDEEPTEVTVNVIDGADGWVQGVLNAATLARTKIKVPSAGRHIIRIYGTDTGVVIDKIVIAQPAP
ncbi:MAG TPA: glycosyl hydrolase 115 family protein [Opitutaceae bacterium]|nr:glycosyl hydrolase 115 family protein [Opitutaceae bacterium]